MKIAQFLINFLFWPMLHLVIGLSAMAEALEKLNKFAFSPKFTENRQNFDEDAEKFGENLKDFGYKFNSDGELRHIETGERFIFDVKKGNRSFNQKHYEALGDVITKEIYELLETEGGLKRIKTPFNARKNEATGFFFASPDYQTNDRLLILVHGSGAVRAGQWARRLIINDNLNTGTQLPYVKKAKEAGFAVVVMNTNQNKMYDEKGMEQYIRDNEDPVSHMFHVWDHFISQSKAKYIAIVAHSAGGYVTVKLAMDKSKEFVERVFAVAFTDSAHASSSSRSAGWQHLLEVGQNWVTSRQSLDSDVPQYRDEIRRVSAGTTSHEETSSKAIDSVYAYIKEKFDEITSTSVSRSEEQSAADSQVLVDEKSVEIPIVPDTSGADATIETVKIDELNSEDKADQENIETVTNFGEPIKKLVEPVAKIASGEIKKKKFEEDDDNSTAADDQEPKIKRGKIEL